MKRASFLQGQLLRILIRRTEGPAETSGEGWLFLSLLVSLACLCCLYVALASPLSPLSYHHRPLEPWLEALLRGLQPHRDNNFEGSSSHGRADVSPPAQEPSYWRLFLTSAEILTAVVPAELPLMLSLSLSMGLLQLARRGICCTDARRFVRRKDVLATRSLSSCLCCCVLVEDDGCLAAVRVGLCRLAAAGEVRVAALDKTGTLTAHAYRLLAVVGVGESPRLEGANFLAEAARRAAAETGHSPATTVPLQRQVTSLLR